MKKLKPFIPLNEHHVAPANIPTFTGNGRHILQNDEFWVVYSMQIEETSRRYKSMSKNPQKFLDLVNFIKGGYADDNESTANEIVGLFVDKADAQKFYDALEYPEER